jgi:Secretion system C-terminal sorting domain
MNTFRFTTFLLLFSSFLPAQTPSDSLTVSPNPFVKRSLIRYYLANADTTSLIILNTLGATTITFYANTLKSSGSYQDSLIMDNFPDGIYFVSLKPKHRSGLSQKIIKTSATSIPKTDSFNNLKVYPNPLKDMLKIELNDFGAANLTLDLLNGIGEVIISKAYSESQNEIDLSSLPKGIYILRIRDSETQKVFKIIKD